MTAWSADLQFVAQGVGLGIPADIQHDIARAWHRFKRDHGLKILANEATVVNDKLRCAGTLDRVVEWQGRYCVLDLKTGSKVDKTAYAIQLSRYAGSVPYDTETDERGAWGFDLDQSIGLVAHLKLNDILKGRQGVYFELVAVGLNAAQHAAQTLHDLKALDLTAAFTIAAPSVSTSPETDVEQPGEGDDRTAAPSPSPTLKEFFDWIEANPTGATIDIADLAPTIDELRAFTDPWPKAEKEAIKAFLDGKDNKNPAVVLDAIVKVRGFGDVVTVPAARPVAATLPTVSAPPTPDEGDDASDTAVDAIQNRYTALTDNGRTWINETANQARKAGLGFHMNIDSGGRRSVRRLRIMTALIDLVEHLNQPDTNTQSTRDWDNLLRGCAWNIAPEIADASAADWGIIVGHFGADEAARFTEIVAAYVAGKCSMRSTLDNKARVEVSAA
jgi:hypothetical protein